MHKIKDKIIIATFGLFLAVILNSCHKYPNDPFLTLKNPNKRLIYYFWQLTSYCINGIDSIAKYLMPMPSSNGIALPNLAFGNGKNGSQNNFIGSGSGDGGAWSLIDHNRKLQVNNSRYNNPNQQICIFPSKITTDWTINELYKTTLKLSSTYNGKSYQLTFIADGKQ